ncbi:MAG: hypothetical protein K1Y02_11490 [Candidatus Hydrogenedentes bacterium]|nr:hypothetical protein [Candidatus Hydrogenedentota bacterium]
MTRWTNWALAAAVAIGAIGLTTPAFADGGASASNKPAQAATSQPVHKKHITHKKHMTSTQATNKSQSNSSSNPAKK